MAQLLTPSPDGSPTFGAPLSTSTHAPRRVARWAALFYVGLAVCGVFAHVYVRTAVVYEPGDAAATAANVVANPDLVRIGIVSDLIGAACYLFLAFALHRLFQHLNRSLANALVTLVAIGAGLTCLNMVFQVGGLLTATDPSFTEAFDAEGSAALTLLMFDLQYYGYILLQVFTGLWLLPFGYLALKSNGFPRPLPYMIMFGCFCYLADLLVQIMRPELAHDISELVLAPAAVAEFWMIGYLVFRGIGRNFIPASEHARSS